MNEGERKEINSERYSEQVKEIERNIYERERWRDIERERKE